MRHHGIAALAAAVLLGCGGDEAVAPRQEETADIRVTAHVAGTPIDLIVARVTAPDIAVALVFNLPVSDGVATGTLRVPPGTGRTIALEAFDDTGGITHDGAATIDVRAGSNPAVSIALLPRGGDVPVTATLGNVSVIVSPGAATLEAGATLQFTAAILGPDDQPVSGTPGWAVTNPALARVDAGGLVTALRSGEVELVATFGGVAGLAQVTVTGGPAGEVTLLTPGGAVADAVAWSSFTPGFSQSTDQCTPGIGTGHCQ